MSERTVKHSSKRTVKHSSTRSTVIVGLVLTGLSMRTAVTSVGAALDPIEHSLGTTSSGSGVITTLPVICFAVLGALAPRVARRVGTHRLIVMALVAMTVGSIARALSDSLVPFLALSVLALAGGAVSNVLMPGLVKLHFPDRIAPMTAVYTTSMAVGQTLAIGLTVPIGSLAHQRDDQWRVGLGSWGLLAAVAIVPWIRTLRGDRPLAGAPLVAVRASLLRHRTAWAMAIFFGFQSLQAYVAFGWFPTFFTDHGASEGTASALVAFYSALSIPVAMAMPALTARAPRSLVVVLGSMLILAYAGMLAAPLGGAWLWMLLAGVGAGQFQLFLTLTGLIAATPAEAAALSAFAQGIGYLIASAGPLLTGVLLGATGSWTWPFAMLFFAQTMCLVSGQVITKRAAHTRRRGPAEPATVAGGVSG